MIWSFEEVPFKGYEGLHPLKNGDKITIFAKDNSILWDGVIDLEYETGYQPYPMNPQYGQQCALGYWVRGNQRGMAIEVWAKMFLDGLDAELEC